MNFCVLSPVHGLERYATLSKTHLLLPQLQAIPGYTEFYRSRREAGDFIILDNGAYEGQTSNPKQLIEDIGRFNPQVVVLPDFPGKDWQKTLSASQSFLDRYFYPLEDKHQFMFVPQSKPGDIVGFIEGLSRALDDERISWIGLPRALTYSITNDLSMRVKMAELIHKRSLNRKIHALGMVKGNVSELKALQETNCVSSIDSNAPVWRGWMGVRLHEPWDEFPVNYLDPNIPEKDGLRDAAILDNLEACGVICRPLH